MKTETKGRICASETYPMYIITLFLIYLMKSYNFLKKGLFIEKGLKSKVFLGETLEDIFLLLFQEKSLLYDVLYITILKNIYKIKILV